MSTDLPDRDTLRHHPELFQRITLAYLRGDLRTRDEIQGSLADQDLSGKFSSRMFGKVPASISSLTSGQRTTLANVLRELDQALDVAFGVTDE